MKILLTLSCSIVIGVAVHAQEAVPPLLLHAAQCLEAKSFLEPSKSAVMSFGFYLDSTSHPLNALYVVEFANPSHSKGWVFTVFLSNDNERQVFDIQNNARFAPSKDGYLGIDFPDPPLGGTWTQEHIVSAIKKIQQSAVFSISNKDLRGTSPQIQCESYAERLGPR